MKGISAFDYLKLRASYGRSGYDIYDYDMDKQYWIGSGSYYFSGWEYLCRKQFEGGNAGNGATRLGSGR